MTPERWQRVAELYHAALSRNPGERQAFLDAQCQGDETLREEVQSLLSQPSNTAALPALGRRLGAYELRGLLGAGGMGEVYRAYDTRLGRDVAIKILPPEFTRDRDRVARFEREARVLASLNHPNIAAIYGIEDGTAAAPALVLELVEGETLADRLAGSGPLAIDAATGIAGQIIDALDAAHQKGIVHRDLKPANIKITTAGTVKVLDFGLAKFTRDGQPIDADRTRALTVSGTREGMIVGTAAYMSPEQARGQAVDKRTDVWAFGCVLYEMLTGRPAFPGETLSDIVAKVLEREPDWTALPATTPRAVERVLRWSLAKDPQRRLRDIGDARLELEARQDTDLQVDAPRTPTRWHAAVAAVAVLAGVAIGVVGTRWGRAPAGPQSRSTARFQISIGPTEVLARNVAISPNGRFVAYVAGPPGNQKTYLRAIDDQKSRLIAELPMQAPPPFFSPDSQWLAFFDAGKLKKMAVTGGSAVTLAEAPTPRGGCWGSDGTIVFAPISRGGLRLLPAGGGPPQELTTPDQGRGETSHRMPTFLPQSRVVLFVADGNAGRALLSVSLDSRQVSVVSTGDGLLPHYVPTGHLAQLIDGKLVIAPFDVNMVRVTGPPATVVEDIDSFSFSDDGTLVFSEAPTYNIRASTVVWTSRDGTETPLPLPAAVYDHPRLSADARTIVLHQESGGDRSLWLYDIARDTLSKFTVSAVTDWPLWSADGARIFYGSNRPGTQWDVMAKPADNSGPEQAVLSRPLTQIPRAVSPTGDTLIYEETYADRPNTLWRLPLRGQGEPRPLFGPGVGEMMPTFSPDGQWVAYVSPHTGRNEIYVRSSSGAGSVWQISNAGGVEPVWGFSGRELFYRADDRMMVVEVTAAGPIAFGKPQVLFDGVYAFGTTEGQQFDVTRDGRRFLMLKPQHPPAPVPLNAIVNWFDDLRRRASTSP